MKKRQNPTSENQRPLKSLPGPVAEILQESLMIRDAALNRAAREFSIDADDVMTMKLVGRGYVFVAYRAAKMAVDLMKEHGLSMWEIAQVTEIYPSRLKTSLKRGPAGYERQPDIDCKNPDPMTLMRLEVDFGMARAEAIRVLQDMRPGKLTRVMTGIESATMNERQAIDVLSCLGMPSDCSPSVTGSSAGHAYDSADNMSGLLTLKEARAAMRDDCWKTSKNKKKRALKKKKAARGKVLKAA